MSSQGSALKLIWLLIKLGLLALVLIVAWQGWHLFQEHSSSLRASQTIKNLYQQENWQGVIDAWPAFKSEYPEESKKLEALLGTCHEKLGMQAWEEHFRSRVNNIDTVILHFRAAAERRELQTDSLLAMAGACLESRPPDHAAVAACLQKAESRKDVSQALLDRLQARLRIATANPGTLNADDLILHLRTLPEGNLDFVKRALKHSDDRVRATAILAIRNQTDEAEAGRIVAPFVKDPSYHIRANTARLLGDIKAYDQMDAILTAMLDEDHRVRELGMRAAGKVFGMVFRYEIGPDSTPAQREQAVSTLRKAVESDAEELRRVHERRRARLKAEAQANKDPR